MENEETNNQSNPKTRIAFIITQVGKSAQERA